MDEINQLVWSPETIIVNELVGVGDYDAFRVRSVAKGRK